MFTNPKKVKWCVKFFDVHGYENVEYFDREKQAEAFSKKVHSPVERIEGVPQKYADPV